MSVSVDNRRTRLRPALAAVLTVLILVPVAQRYRLGLLPGARVIPAGGLTLRPRAGLPMLLSPVPAS